jgi:hypothetical protein
MRLFLKMGLVALGAALALEACNRQASSEDGVICDPGENIFCRCPGGDPGTKSCRPDGKGFEPCVSRSGECPALGPATSSTSSSSGGGEAGSGGEGGSGGGPVFLGTLYDPCESDEACESGFCPMGYCTRACFRFEDCEAPAGDCIRVQDFAFCLKSCASSQQCVDSYGEPSLCGYAETVDGLGYTICGHWDPAPRLPPEGSQCWATDECNLGNLHRQRVCASQICIEGCYEDLDCPDETNCRFEGSIGSCL